MNGSLLFISLLLFFSCAGMKGNTGTNPPEVLYASAYETAGGAAGMKRTTIFEIKIKFNPAGHIQFDSLWTSTCAAKLEQKKIGRKTVLLTAVCAEPDPQLLKNIGKMRSGSPPPEPLKGEALISYKLTNQPCYLHLQQFKTAGKAQAE